LALSYFGIKKSQEELGQELRPYQNPEGDNDDKSVTFDEMGGKAEEFGLLSYHRPNGSIAMLKDFIAAGVPVITRTWLNADEDIGHYRIIKGYDHNAKTILMDDTYEGKAQIFSYDEFNTIWEKFNFEYLVIVPKEKKLLAERILGKNLNETYAWEQARDKSLNELKNDPDNSYSRFNLAIAYYHLGDYKKTVEQYEIAEPSLPFRMLWYQIEPIDAYFQLGNYDKVFEMTDAILNNQNRAYSELYLLRGKIYEKQGNIEAAKAEYENAVYYNINLPAAKEALGSL
jgi:tetratricopeptide (TPR) repeat protein